MKNINENYEDKFISLGNEYKFKINNQTENIKEMLQKRTEEEFNFGIERFMPIGSVVQLKGSSELKMIIGFKYSVEDKNYDYVACTYPYGIGSEHGMNVFNHNQIERIYHVGYINFHEKGFKEELLAEEVKKNK